jgi:plastocyanin
MGWIFSLVVAVATSGALASASAQEESATIVIRDHVFQPAELYVPVDTVILLTVDNQDQTPEEFESGELRVEKIIPGGSSGLVRFGPLKTGTYSFFGEFNQATAQGKVIAE